MAYHRNHGLETRIVRIFNTYGPRMRLNDGRVVPNFVYQALTGRPLTVYGDGSHTRSFLYCADLIEGTYRLLLSNENHPVNIGNTVEMSMLDFARAVLDLSGSKSGIVNVEPTDDRVTDDPKVRRPDISRARQILGWEPETRFEDGLARTIEYYRDRVD